MVSKGRWAYSFAEGKRAEQKFMELMLARGHKCVKTNRKEDMQKHIDFYVNDIGIDVKGNKRLESIWLELKNVKGDKGWLLGKAEIIVFDIVELQSFCFFKRKDLYLFVKNITEVAKDKNDYMKLYTRKDRQDVIVKVTYNNIKHLQQQAIKYDTKGSDVSQVKQP